MKNKTGTWVIRFFLILWAVIVVAPFVFLLMTSLKTNSEFFENIWGLPKNIAIAAPENFKAAWTEADMGHGMVNSFMISAIALVASLVLSSCVSYVIARRHIRLGNTLSIVFLIGLLVPEMLGLTPLFIIAKYLGLYNTRAILVFIYTAWQMPFDVYLMTSFMETLPHEMEEAAYVDGATPWQSFLKIIVPLVKPALITAGIFSFLDYWSDYMYGLMFVMDGELKPLAMNILKFKTGNGVRVEWGITSAACVIFILPVLIIYVIFQKRIVSGLTAGSVKG